MKVRSLLLAGAISLTTLLSASPAQADVYNVRITVNGHDYISSGYEVGKLYTTSASCYSRGPIAGTLVKGMISLHWVLDSKLRVYLYPRPGVTVSSSNGYYVSESNEDVLVDGRNVLHGNNTQWVLVRDIDGASTIDGSEVGASFYYSLKSYWSGEACHAWVVVSRA